VLFGAANPAGHLPDTFPASASQTPVSSPQQFPGVNSQVDYSEGVDVGSRWYDQHHVTPLFPFGYGLSYTTFSYSHLHAAGRGGPLAQVTATVTNTGKVAVSFADWFSDSAVAGGTVVATVPWNLGPGSTLGPHQVSVYSATVPLDPGKTVASVTLPTDFNMHIFALAEGG
jgi:glycosyl hydrolase family 3